MNLTQYPYIRFTKGHYAISNYTRQQNNTQSERLKCYLSTVLLYHLLECDHFQPQMRLVLMEIELRTKQLQKPFEKC